MTSTIRKAACVVLFRIAPKVGTQVFLARRSKNLSFLGGFDVFPGGTQDSADALYSTTLAKEGCTELALTAMRELFEETGVLALADEAALPAKSVLVKWRADLLNTTTGGSQKFFEILEAKGLRFATDKLFSLGFWRTPPYTPTIYEADYYGLWLPPHQSVSIIPGELTQGDWYTPTEALSLHEQGQLFISYPVLTTIRTFADENLSFDDACAKLAGRTPHTPHFGGQLLQGIHICPLKTFTLPPATHTNCYILGDGELAIVDPGSPIPQEQQKLLSYLQDLKEQGAQPKEIWLTHEHKDHIGAVDCLRKTLGIPVKAHAETARLLHGEIPVDCVIPDEEVLHLKRLKDGPPWAWKALHTPGHARGHLCFYDGLSRTLLSGDNVLGLGTVLISPPLGHMATYMNSLRRLRDLHLGFMLPAHGPPIATPHEKIDEYLAHRLAREEAIMTNIAYEPVSPRELVETIYHDTDRRAWPLAEMNVRAHLEKLLEEKRLNHSEQGYYRPSQ